MRRSSLSRVSIAHPRRFPLQPKQHAQPVARLLEVSIAQSRLHPTRQFNHTYGYRAQRFQGPLLFPEHTAQTCEHAQFAKGKGCVKDVNWERGGIQRVTLDRDGPLFHSLYRQRTGCERINARAKELGIERPRVRNARSVAHLNSLTYVIVNVQVLMKAKSINARLLQLN